MISSGMRAGAGVPRATEMEEQKTKRIALLDLTESESLSRFCRPSSEFSNDGRPS